MMKYNPLKKELKLGRELSNLDKFVLKFTNILEKHADYVIVSGYVSILLGRSRSTEDIDLLASEINLEDFKTLFADLEKNDFECINTSKPEAAFEMLKGHAIRFFEKGKPTPNIEFKSIKTELDSYSFNNKIKVLLDRSTLNISPLELQIAYKLFLAAEGLDEELRADKDIEDARYLYKLFKEKLNKEEFHTFIDKLKVKNKLKYIE